MLAGIFSQRYAMQPLVIALQRGEELLDPARTPIGSPAVGAGLGPTPKFLAIVSHDHNAVAVESGQSAQGLDRFAHRSPGDGVAQGFAGGVDLQGAALILGRVVAIQVAILQPYVLEMHIVEDGPLDLSLA